MADLSNDLRNGNDMAYPCLDTAYTPNGTVQVGLTKRELFAAMAMQGMSSSETDEVYWNDDKLAARAVKRADALLAALENRDGQ